MENYKIIQALRSLDKKELRRFGDFVTSPYFNKNEPVIALFGVLEKNHPEFNSRNFTIEKIFAKVFPKDEYNYHKINNVISDLYRLFEKFLAQTHIEKKEFYIERNLFRELRERKLYKIYEQKFTGYMKELIDRNYKDEDYYYYLYEINDEYLWYATLKKPNTELNILQTEFDHYIRYTLIRLLRFYNLMLHEKNQTNVNYRLTMFNDILKFLETDTTLEVPAIKVFKTILFLLHTKDKKYYDELWSLKEKYFSDFNSDDKRLIYIHLYDFAAYMVNFKGDDVYNRDMFKIYKEMLETEFITPSNFLYPDFMNIVKIACRVKEFDFARAAVERFKPALLKNGNENAIEFCCGTIENATGNLSGALEHFSKSNFQNFIFKVQVKISLLQIYYRLGMYDQAESIIDTFKHFVSREDNLLEEHRKSYNMFLNLMSELIRVQSSETPDKDFKLHKLKKQAAEIPANPFRVKVWLLERISDCELRISD